MKKIADIEKYRARIMDYQVKRYLKTFGAVCIEGPKWCSKTWISSYHSNNIGYFSKKIRFSALKREPDFPL